MSTCISRHGEYGSHIPDADYVCTRCFVQDDEALIAELNAGRAQVAELTAERDDLQDAVVEQTQRPHVDLRQAEAERDAAVARLGEEQRAHEATRTELAVLADSAEPYGECNPNCDCSGHEGPRTCDCHITGTEARARIESLVAQCETAEAELERLRLVVEVARAAVVELASRVPGGAGWDERVVYRLGLLTAAVDVLDADGSAAVDVYRSGNAAAQEVDGDG